ADVPELLQVEVLGALGGLHTERGIAARTTPASDVITLFHLFRQREKRLERGVGGIDIGLGDAVVADTGKAPLPVGSPQLGDEGVAVGLETGDIEGWNLAHNTIL